MSDDQQFAVDNQNSPPDPRPLRLSFWLFHLFVRPRRFFREFPRMATSFTVVYSAWIVGVEEAVFEAMPDFESGINTNYLMDSWASFWALCAFTGVITAALTWKIGGWWYRVRLRMSGDAAPDRALARRVFIFASLIHAFPLVTLAAVNSAAYATPLDTEDSWGWSTFSWAIIFPPWSFCTSYLGVRTIFDVRKWAARIWFFFLPMGTYFGLILGSV